MTLHSNFTPYGDKVFVTELEAGVRKTQAGIILPDDNMTNRGVRSRWARVWGIGPEVKDIAVGDWVLVEHGRWTNGIDLELDDGVVRIWHIDFPAAVLVVSDVDPRGEEMISL